MHTHGLFTHQAVPSFVLLCLVFSHTPSKQTMKLTKFLVLLLAILAISSNFFITSAAAQDDDEEEDNADADDATQEDEDYEQPSDPVHPLTNMEGPSPDVVTTYVLPGHTTGDTFNIAVNKHNSIIVGFVNKREADSEGNAMKVKAIAGSLNSGYNFATYIQNFTILGFNPQEVVDPGAEMTFEYNFQIDGATDLQQSQLSLTIFYEDDNEDFTTTFFNETVMLFEENNGFDREIIGTYLILLAILGTGGYFLWGVVKVQLGIKTSKSKSTTSSSSGPTDFSDYDGDLVYSTSVNKNRKNKAIKKKAAAKAIKKKAAADKKGK